MVCPLALPPALTPSQGDTCILAFYYMIPTGRNLIILKRNIKLIGLSTGEELG